MYGRLTLYWIILVGAYSIITEGKLSFTVEPSDIVYAPGQSLILNCQASDSKGRSILINWKRNNVWLTNMNNQPWTLLRNNSLYFKSISKQDGGSFMCGASISGTAEVIYSRVASVQSAYTSDVFSSSPSNQTKRVGDASAYFTCVTGNSLPFANVYWEKNGIKLSSNDVTNQQLSTPTPGVTWTSSTLSIINIDLSSAGFYRCVAVNSFVTSIVRRSNTGYLKVLPQTDKPHFQVHPTNMVAAEHKPSVLQCVILGVPPPKVTWTYNGHPLISSPDRQYLANGSLYFPSVNRTYTGQYRCKGTNNAGSIESTDVLFSVAYFDFQFIEHPSSQNVTVGDQVTLRCQPPSSFPVDLIINWFKNYQPIQPGPGITIASSGSLVFSSIKKSDEGKYFCNGENKVLKAARSSYVAVVTVWVPPTFTKPPVDTAVIKHHRLALHCDATGYPSPSFSWLKDGSKVNTSHVTLLANGSLIIERAEVKDAGNYSCHAANVADQVVSYAIVDIYVAPSVSSRPSDAVRVLGQPITFKCGFHGNPTPRVEWYRGKNLTFSPVPSTPKYNMTGGTLKVTSVTIDDEGTYICKAINVAGSVNISVHLNVQVPVSLDAGPVNITVNQSSPASFKCVASGDPKPNITWYKKSVLLQNGGRLVITGETLSIPRTLANDAGEYQCHVTNGLAQHVGKAYLVVQVVPNIGNFQVTPYVLLGGTTFLTCQSNSIPRPQVTWYMDNDVITGSRFTQFVNGSLRIVGVTRLDQGMYMCKASNAAGQTARNSTLTVQVPPDPPLHFSAISLSSTSIKLSWQPGFNGHSPITSYKIEVKIEGQSVFTEVEPSLIGRELVLRHLQPYTKYLFKVSARNVVGLGRSAQASNTTFQDAPSQPRNVRLVTLNSTAMEISWSAPSQLNGVITRYEIVYQSLPNGSVFKVERLGSSVLKLVVTSLRSFTDYKVKVRAATIIWGNFSENVLQTTGEAGPSEAPRDIICRAIGPMAVLVIWKPVPVGSANGRVRGYRILYTSDVQNGTAQINNNRTSNFTIQRLLPWTFYDISVQAYTVDFGPSSDWKTVRTHEAAPSGVPNVFMTSPNESSILVTIDPPPLDMRNGIIIGFNISYKMSNSLMYNHVFVSANGTAKMLLSNLDVYTEYTVTVTAATKAGVGPSSSEIKERTQEGVPNAVSSLKSTMNKPNEVTVTWSPPQPITGIIIHYNVTYNTSSGHVFMETTSKTSLTLTGLKYNTSYHIWVVAKTSKGYGMPGSIVNIITGTRPTLPPTTAIPSTTATNATEEVIKSTNGQVSGIFVSDRDMMIILICTGVVLLLLIVIIIYCGCSRLRREPRIDPNKGRKMATLDPYELRGVSLDRRPVLDVQEDMSAISADSFDDFSEFNSSSITGIISEQTNSEPIPKKTSSPSPPSSELTGIHAAQPHPVTRTESNEKKSKPRAPYVPLNKTHLSKLKNKKLSLGSNDSYYDQPYQSVDELGAGFSSFTPPPPEDFRNPHSTPSSSEDTPRDPPKEFSNKLYSAVQEHPDEVMPQTIPSEYAEPEEYIPRSQMQVHEEEIEPEVVTPPPQAFMSDFEGVENDGYNTDEELDNYLGKQEAIQSKPSMSSQSPTSSHSPASSQSPTSSKSPTSPTSSRSQSASPTNRDDAMPVYAVVDKSKKKKKKKKKKGEQDHDPVVVYDERTNL